METLSNYIIFLWNKRSDIKRIQLRDSRHKKEMFRIEIVQIKNKYYSKTRYQIKSVTKNQSGIYEWLVNYYRYEFGVFARLNHSYISIYIQAVIYTSINKQEPFDPFIRMNRYVLVKLVTYYLKGLEYNTFENIFEFTQTESH